MKMSFLDYFNLRRAAFVLMFISSTAAHAGIVNLGIVSFDVLTPAGIGSPGVNVFEISNLTGNPAVGGFALPPDFPAFASLLFLGSTLKVTNGGSMQTINLGSISPGPVGAITLLEFPSSTMFSSAIFSAMLSGGPILLFDNSTFTPSSTTITATLMPSSGPSLVAGTDLAVISVADVPEPNTFGAPLTGCLLLLALAGLYRSRWDRKISG